MEIVSIKLTEFQYNQVMIHSSTEKRAIEICKIYFKSKEQAVEFIEDGHSGGDLVVKLPTEDPFEIEIKGTEEDNIAWGKLKVSSNQCHQKLINGMPLYRVTNVSQSSVKLFIMKYLNDYDMVVEPRWRVIPKL